MTEAPPRYGQAPRGVSARDVELAADVLLRAGERPTIEKVREKLGSGSPNTINPLLDAWWKRLSARLDAGPAALHRLPESVAHAAEALWMQALDEGRRRGAQEQGATARALASDKQTLEVRSHVLSLREGELESRLRDREQRQAVLEAQLQDLTTLLRKEQATRDAQARRISALEDQLSVRAPATQRPTRTKSQTRQPHRRKAQRAVASPSGRAVQPRRGESGARARLASRSRAPTGSRALDSVAVPIPQRSQPERAKRGGRPPQAKARSKSKPRRRR